VEGKHDGMVSTIDSLLMGMAAARITGPARPALADFTSLLENLLAGQGDAWLADLATGSSASPAERDGSASAAVQGEPGSPSDLAAVLLALISQTQQEQAGPDTPVPDGEPRETGISPLVGAVEPDPATFDAPPGPGDLPPTDQDAPAGEDEPSGVSVTDDERIQALLALLAAAMPTATPPAAPAHSLPTAASTKDEPAEPVMAVAAPQPGAVPATGPARTVPDRTDRQPEHVVEQMPQAPWTAEATSHAEPPRVALAEPGTAMRLSEDVSVTPTDPAATVEAAVTAVAAAERGPTTPSEAASATAWANRLDAPVGEIEPTAEPTAPPPPQPVNSDAASPLSADRPGSHLSNEPDRQVVAAPTAPQPEGSEPIAPREAPTHEVAAHPTGDTGPGPANAAPSSTLPDAVPLPPDVPQPTGSTAIATSNVAAAPPAGDHPTATSDPAAAPPALPPQAVTSDAPPAEAADPPRAPAPAAPVSDRPTEPEWARSAPEPVTTPSPATTGSAPAGDRPEVAPVDATAGHATSMTGTTAPAQERDDTPLRLASIEADMPAGTELRAALSNSAAPPAQHVRAAPAEPVASPAAPQVAQVLERVEHMLHAGRTSVRVRLEPEWLGPVEIRVVSRHAGLGIELIAHTPEARHLLERDLGWLHRGLVETGHEVQRIRVSAPDSLPDGTAGTLVGQGGEHGWRGHGDPQAEADWRQSFRLYQLGSPERDGENRPRAIAGQRAVVARGIDVRI